jgi:hypothetical protein
MRRRLSTRAQATCDAMAGWPARLAHTSPLHVHGISGAGQREHPAHLASSGVLHWPSKRDPSQTCNARKRKCMKLIATGMCIHLLADQIASEIAACNAFRVVQLAASRIRTAPPYRHYTSGASRLPCRSSASILLGGKGPHVRSKVR